MKSLSQCKSGKEIVHYVTSHGGTVRDGHGSHRIVSTTRGSVVVPVHGNHDLGTGLRCKILKVLAAIGITAFVVSYVVLATV